MKTELPLLQIQRRPADYWSPPDNITEQQRLWTPLVSPFVQLALKVQRACDLRCPPCYEYSPGPHAQDRTHQLAMTPAKAALAAQRMVDHMQAHEDFMQRRGLQGSVILHGGEPLLDPENLLHIVRAVKGVMGADTKFAVQTNMLSATPDVLQALHAEGGISIGASLDGGRVEHNKSRPLPGGRGSYDQVAANLEVLRDLYPDMYAGILCTINLKHQYDPLATYAACKQFVPVQESGKFTIGFQLPHATRDKPPYVPPGNTSATPYADWLTPIMDEWGVRDWRQIRIPLFEYIRLSYNVSRAQRDTPDQPPPEYGWEDYFGREIGGVVFVDPDGSIRQSDTYRIIGGDGDATGKHIETSTFDEVLQQAADHAGHLALAAACQSNECGIREPCYGGRPSFRYSKGNGFDNTAVYCQDFRALFGRYYAAMDQARGVSQVC